MMNSGALIVVPLLLREDTKLLSDDVAQSNVQPQLFSDRVVDSFQNVNLQNYLFNATYSTKLNSFYSFLPRNALEINDMLNCPTKTLDLVFKLKSDNLI